MGGMGGRDRHFALGRGEIQVAAAKALGLTTDQLHAALRGGKSLADVAKSQKVSVDSLVKAMVTATETQLATEVKDGNLTQAQADRMKSSLTQRITDRVNRVRPDRGQGHRPDGVQGSSSSDNATGGASSTT